jgi:hypothetical protein
VAYSVANLLIDLKKKPIKAEPCGKKATCYKCTRCTSTGISRHRPAGTFNECGTALDLRIRAQLIKQLDKILAK